MRVLLVSYAFAPSIGGVETASLILATELRRRGHEVAVATATQVASSPAFDYPVHYRPSPGQLVALHRWSDLVLHNGYSLRFAWPLLLVRRPWVIVHASDFRPGLLRRLIARTARHISVSSDVARTVPVPSTVVANAYRTDVFSKRNEGARRYRFGFVGRLVSDKGAAHLLEALARLTGAGEFARCAIVGAGPEEERLRMQARTLGLEERVDFLGVRREAALAAILNEIDCLVVPSIWNEPFGIVALEGIACGCVVVGSQGGGLKDAIGPCGLTYPNGDVSALAAALQRIADEPDLSIALRKDAPGHLARHTPQAMGDAYMQIVAEAIGTRKVHGIGPLG